MQQLRARAYEAEDDDDVQRLFRERGWTDGLPVVAPTPERVQAMLDWAGWPPDHVVGVEPVKARPLTAEKLAVNAVLAGCLPPDFPVLVTAVEAMCRAEFLVHGATASTGGCAVLLVVNGPVRHQLGMSSAHSVLAGPDRASICIGRAARLVLRNLLEVRPGELDRSTLGHPGKISWCLAEDEEGGAPWLPLAQERGIPADVSAVTAFAASGPRQLMNEWTTEPTELLATVVAEVRATMLHYSIWAGNYALVVPPQLRKVFHDAGWSKADIRQFVFEHARVKRSDWEAVGKRSVVTDRNRANVYQALPTPEHLLVISAGGEAGGFAAVIPPWLGPNSAAATAAVGACVDC
ncbi:MAG: hypothetical protein GEV08_23665 [Acidimicrobiia bacterium]|nr:hypothetical protein [Acidimicrobiia bacterium]